MDYSKICFIITFTITILNLLKFLSLFAKNTLSLPYYKQLDPTSWWMFYPSFVYQVLYWSVKYSLV